MLYTVVSTVRFINVVLVEADSVEEAHDKAIDSMDFYQKCVGEEVIDIEQGDNLAHYKAMGYA